MYTDLRFVENTDLTIVFKRMLEQKLSKPLIFRMRRSFGIDSVNWIYSATCLEVWFAVTISAFRNCVTTTRWIIIVYIKSWQCGCYSGWSGYSTNCYLWFWFLPHGNNLCVLPTNVLSLDIFCDETNNTYTYQSYLKNNFQSRWEIS